MRDKRGVVQDMLADFRGSWRQLALGSLAYKILAIVVITPIVGVLFRVLLAMSGRTVLADTDMLYFFVQPLGWICLVVVGGLWIAIIAAEQCTLLGILAAARQGNTLGIINALRFTRSRAIPVIAVSARLVAISLGIAIPFLVVGGAVYWWLLADYDINYYLTQTPPEFWLAAVLIGLDLAILAAIYLRLFSGWFFALPIVTFEVDHQRDALGTSTARSRGHRRTIAFWIAVWFVVTVILSALLTGSLNLLGRSIIPTSSSSLGLLFLMVGGLVIAWLLTHLVVNLLSTVTFSIMIFNVYQAVGGGNIEAENQLIHHSTVVSNRARFRLSPRRLVAAFFCGLLFTVIVGGVIVESIEIEDRTTIAAHRGASADAPENTMAAVEEAIRQGADYVEIDVQETADGEVVVFHDSDFKKIAGLDLRIWDATMKDLAAIDVGSFFNPEFDSERVPTLRSVLEKCRGRIRVNIELKYYGHEQDLEQRVVDIVEATGMDEEIIVMSLKIDGIRKIKKLRPQWQAGLLTAVALGDLTRMDADFLAVNGDLATRPFVRRAHQAGKEVHVWTINDAITMSNMIGRRVDCLITDRPGLARSVLEQRATMSPVERLLMELAELFGAQPQIAEQ